MILFRLFNGQKVAQPEHRALSGGMHIQDVQGVQLLGHLSVNRWGSKK